MRNELKILSVVACTLLVGGCSSDKGQNQGQCGRYVDYYNELPCTKDRQIDFLQTCPDELADLQCPDDISEYYQCLIDGTICVGGVVDTVATGNCAFECTQPSPTATPSATPRPSATPSPTATATFTPTLSVSPTATASPTSTVSPSSATPTPSGSVSPTPTG